MLRANAIEIVAEEGIARSEEMPDASGADRFRCPLAIAPAGQAGRAGIFKPRCTAGRARNAASARLTFVKSSKPTRAPAS
jgi:hypothetical protein